MMLKRIVSSKDEELRVDGSLIKIIYQSMGTQGKEMCLSVKAIWT